MRRRRFVGVLLLAMPLAIAGSGRDAARAITTCTTIFPSDSVWHTKVSSLPPSSRSAAYVNSIGATTHVHPDFGSGLIDGAPFGMPITDVGTSAPAVRVTFDYADESDAGPYRIPANALVEGGSASTGDRHVIVLDRATCTAYELYDAHRRTDGSWQAGSGAIWNLRSNALRPAGWTSADAAGLPVIAGLVRYSEIAAGRVNHAIRMTVPRTDRRYVWPARHYASSVTSSTIPAMGIRFRLRQTVDISWMPRQSRIIAQALKDYGAIVADNGSAWFIGGTQDSRWDNAQLDALKTLRGVDFVALNENGLMIDPNSARARTAVR